MITEVQKFSPEAIARAKQHFPLPHGLLESIADGIKANNPEGSPLYEKAVRLGELLELTRDHFPNERRVSEISALTEELLWQVEEFYSPHCCTPAWPSARDEFSDYLVFGLA
ncbi:MAG: hypothetical protein KIT46_02540 [Anaerolineales bacterium]|nr:hypothetical protein [Anaerolineales bacterium]MCW5854904.1 hypothetical protein [Anaerolineales bacterium]